MGFLGTTDRPSALATQVANQMRDLDWTLAHFTFVANVTTLAAECDIAHSPAMSVASCRSQPDLELAFLGESSDLLATYATFLADPGSVVSLLVSDEQRDVVESAFDVDSVVPHWQMLYSGDPRDLDAGSVTEVVENDLSAVQSLARSEEYELTAFSASPLAQGLAFGIWERRRLIAMGMTVLELPKVVWLGNVVVRSECRRRGLASAVVAGLLQHHLSHGRTPFSVVRQDDQACVGFFERMGFERARPLHAMKCVLR